MHTKFEFDFETTATPEQVVELMTDFSPNRPHRWPASSVKAFEVYRLGETDADIREGQDFPKLWATWHYDWSTPDSVTLSITDSDALQPGGFMTLTATPKADGWQLRARRVGAIVEESHRTRRRDDDAAHRPEVSVVLLQEGLRRALTVQLGCLLSGHLAHDVVDRPTEGLDTETDCQRPQLSGLVGD